MFYVWLNWLENKLNKTKLHYNKNLNKMNSTQLIRAPTNK